jgi:uncharacterized repeat protein (TIGR03803 family)
MKLKIHEFNNLQLRRMSKKLFSFLFLYFSVLAINAQCTLLHRFNDTLGDYPSTSYLVHGGNKLFGMTPGGGVNNYGVIFSIDTTGAAYKVLENINSTGAWNPVGSLTLVGRKLFGTLSLGGLNGYGIIFSIDTNGTGFTDVLDFNYTNGASPFSSLTLFGNKLYGTAKGGGAHNYGDVYSIDTNGTGFTDLYDFTGTYGNSPWGTVRIAGNRCYGMTYVGGANNFGVVYSISITGGGFKDMLDFNQANGQQPEGELTIVGNKCYGMTQLGGTHIGSGLIFSIDTDGTGYRDLLDFNGTNGGMGYGDLTFIDNKLYGMTSSGGSNNEGLIFSLDTNGSGYKDVMDFTGPNGSVPQGSLTISGKNFYGMTNEGATPPPYGVIFKYQDTSIITGMQNSSAPISTNCTLFPNPNSGAFTLQVNSEKLKMNSVIEIYNMLGEKVYSQISLPTTQYSLDLSNQSAGIYFYRVLTESGNLVAEGKFVIQK